MRHMNFNENFLNVTMKEEFDPSYVLYDPKISKFSKVHQIQKSSEKLNFLFLIHGLIQFIELIMNIAFLFGFHRVLEEKSSKYEESSKKQENDHCGEKSKFYLFS